MTTEIDDGGIRDIVRAVERQTGYRVDSHRLELFGAARRARPRTCAVSRGVLAVAALIFAVAACSPSGSPAASGATIPRCPPRVVATTTVLADMVKQVGGPNVDASSIVPKGAVVETFDPSPQDVASSATPTSSS